MVAVGRNYHLRKVILTLSSTTIWQSSASHLPPFASHLPVIYHHPPVIHHHLPLPFQEGDSHAFI
jgi:hypothetical protein